MTVTTRNKSSLTDVRSTSPALETPRRATSGGRRKTPKSVKKVVFNSEDPVEMELPLRQRRSHSNMWRARRRNHETIHVDHDNPFTNLYDSMMRRLPDGLKEGLAAVREQAWVLFKEPLKRPVRDGLKRVVWSILNVTILAFWIYCLLRWMDNKYCTKKIARDTWTAHTKPENWVPSEVEVRDCVEALTSSRERWFTDTEDAITKYLEKLRGAADSTTEDTAAVGKLGIEGDHHGVDYLFYVKRGALNLSRALQSSGYALRRWANGVVIVGDGARF